VRGEEKKRRREGEKECKEKRRKPFVASAKAGGVEL
jgi:hypothetical protein